MLPDDHPAAALWWRISRHLSPAVTLDPGHSLATGWTEGLPSLVGEQRATELQASLWWPALVAVVDHAVQRGWTVADVLAQPPSGPGEVDPCQALVWRTSLLINPLVDHEGLDPDAPPHDLWDGYHPEPAAEWLPPESAEVVVAVPAGAAAADAFDEVDEILLGEDAGPDFTLEAMIRNALPAPEPSDADIRVLLAHGDAWRESGTTPERLAQINQWASEFYQHQFPGSWARAYLRDRFGVDLTGNQPYQPGYAPNAWTTLTTHLRRRGVTDHELLVAGLAQRASTGRLIDRFRDRAVFPIIHDGHVLGFVGRRHPRYGDTNNAGPKYLNTPDTPLFHKGAQLYAAEELLGTGATPVLVEGPMDALAITLATNGACVGVAPLGTSLTDEQAAHIAAWGRQPIVATDADLAGQVAAERDYWILTHHRMDPLHAQLPAGTDPADLLAIGDRAILRAALRDARPLADTLITERLDHLPPIDGTLAAVRVLAAQPSGAWKAGASRIASRHELPDALVSHAIHDAVVAWNKNPRAATLAGLSETSATKERLTQQTVDARPTPFPPRSEGRDLGRRTPVARGGPEHLARGTVRARIPRGLPR